MFASLIRRSAASSAPRSTPPLNIYNNPYKAKRTWPPDLSKLSKKHQFRLERRYRRRAKLKWARPGWTKATKIAQWTAGTFVVVYGVLFMDLGGRTETPFRGIREWYQGLTESLWSSRSSQAGEPNLRTPPPTS